MGVITDLEVGARVARVKRVIFVGGRAKLDGS